MSDVVVKLTMDAGQYDKALRKAERQMKSFKKSSYLAKSMVKEFRSQLMGFASVGVVVGVLGDVVQKTMEFEKAISSLSSLTGMVGEDLNYLRQQSIILGATTTQTASQVADAFKLIGSQQPQLLQSKEALVAVTRSAITLAEASESDVPTAAKALSGALNQMGAGAEYAQSYINILAAASQKGSADINYLNKAVEKSGGTANAVGVKFNELVAAIETIAPKVTEASEAGTQLRNIFLTLEGSTDKNLKPSVVGLGTAIDNLSAMQLDAAGMAKMFGKENVNAALALVKSKDTYHDLTEAITGTNTAMEQAQTNTDNLAGAWTRMGSAWEGLILTFNKSDGVLKNIVDWSAEALDNIRQALMSAEQLSAENVAKGSSDIINKSYGNITKRMDAGMSREGSYQMEIIRLQDRRDIENNRLVKYQKNYNTKEAYYQKIRNSGLYSTQSKFEANVDRGKAEDALKKQKELLESYDAAIKALKQQAIMVPTTTTGGTSSTRGSGSAGGKVAKVYAPGSIGAYQAELSKLNEELNSATTVESRQQIQAEIDTVQRLIDAIRELNSVKDITIGPNGEVVNLEADASYKAPSVADLTPAYDSSELMNDLNLDYHEMVEVTKSWRKETDKSMSSVEQWGIALQGVSGILDQTSNKWLQLAGTVLNVVNNILQETSSGGGALGSIIGGFSTIFAGAFADGGIVKGQRYNDGIVARVSSGEMIINQADQRKLFNSIKSGNTGGGGGMVRMTLRGEDLISAINNYGSRSGMGKIKFE